MKRILIEMSRRHAHLSARDCEALFGKPTVLCVRNMLSQPGQFAATNTVSAHCRERKLDNIRVVGPFRPVSQLEVALRDASALAINPPRRISGDTAGAPAVTLIGPAGTAAVPVIFARRHLHCDAAIAELWNVAPGDSVSVAMENGGVIDDIVVRVSERAYPVVHVDEDEAGAFGLGKKEWGNIIF